MGNTHKRYAPEYRQRMVELVRAGRCPEELAREFQTSSQSIRNWVAQADRDEGRRRDGLTTAEREELTRLRRENRILREEREILSKAAAWFATETGSLPSRGPIRECESGQLSNRDDVPGPGCLPQWLLCMAKAAARGAQLCRCAAQSSGEQDSSTLGCDLWSASGPRRAPGRGH